jgi:enamine deaminase RidA (YjgF/YER057c/UK114 family)
MSIEIVNPAHWSRPRGFSNGMIAEGRQIYVAGQVGWDEHGRFASTGLPEQLRQALRNVVAVLASAGASPQHVVRLTWYITDARQYRERLAEVGVAYRDVMGKNFPTMSVVEVRALVEPEACVEIEATAVLPAGNLTEPR